jgi:hypothetical protein
MDENLTDEELIALATSWTPTQLVEMLEEAARLDEAAPRRARRHLHLLGFWNQYRRHGVARSISVIRGGSETDAQPPAVGGVGGASRTRADLAAGDGGIDPEVRGDLTEELLPRPDQQPEHGELPAGHVPGLGTQADRGPA